MKDFSYITSSDPAYIENLYNEFVKDPESIDPDFKKFFEGFDFAVANNKTGVNGNVAYEAEKQATKKDMRQAAKRRDRNRYYGKTTRNAIRDLRVITDQKGAKEAIPAVESMIDKLAKRGIIHKNKAANLKSKLAKRVNALASA